ncbi:MAG: DEAD/DEAH box helicase [bacterium]
MKTAKDKHKKIFNITKQNTVNYTDLIETLSHLGYSRVDMVLVRGEFAVRGEIIDIFGYTNKHPNRIEYNGNCIERLSQFDIETQRSKKEEDEIKVQSVPKKQDPLQLEQTKHPKTEFQHFEIDDYVVHEDHGIAQYKGLKHIKTTSLQGEFFELKFKDSDHLYISIDNLEKIHPYNEQEKATLTHLYRGEWSKKKARVQTQLNTMLEDIYHCHKKRRETKGIKYKEDSLWQLDFENQCEFELTKDQRRAVTEIKEEMEDGRVMDRLICGDVGYGKTEVMMRAAFKTVENDKQVLILVPTTILAQQHEKNIKKRLEKFPIKVAQLSRLIEPSLQKIYLKQIEKQQIDILVGTHRVLQNDVKFANLGLLVIDEEQRFGVRHKERIKHLKNNINVMTLSATPIPRTLYHALTGAKDISKISTAPKGRKAVTTILSLREDRIIKQAIEKEVSKKGQVFYVYNNIENMEKKKKYLSTLCPNIKIDIAHGQLSAQALSKIMQSFIKGESQVLLCSTIIENGLDIHNANTLIIDEAQNFGLAQIHQLRGRVGRGHRQGIAYLLINKEEEMTEKAKKRLRAIKASAVLGSGYTLAMKDLEIRGAGAMFGQQQHGHIFDVGFSLYCKMIEETLSRLRNETQKRKINLNPRLYSLPSDYMSGDQDRQWFYKQIQIVQREEELIELRHTLRDRFGKLPLKVKKILHFIATKLGENET